MTRIIVCQFHGNPIWLRLRPAARRRRRLVEAFQLQLNTCAMNLTIYMVADKTISVGSKRLLYGLRVARLVFGETIGSITGPNLTRQHGY